VCSKTLLKKKCGQKMLFRKKQWQKTLFRKKCGQKTLFRKKQWQKTLFRKNQKTKKLVIFFLMICKEKE
jgi:DNA-directed RNA polymerase subunit M/transcription elongation factor TFIIS